MNKMNTEHDSIENRRKLQVWLYQKDLKRERRKERRIHKNQIHIKCTVSINLQSF